MSETIEGYGILITRKDGTAFLASGGSLGCFIAKKRTAAVQRKRALEEHIDSKMKIVKVIASWRVVP